MADATRFLISEKVAKAVSRSGPLTGAELAEVTKENVFELWQACYQDPKLYTACSGRRFLRLDRRIEGYARLSPSIRREFLTYTVVGLAKAKSDVKARCDEVETHIRQVSVLKRQVARSAVMQVTAQLAWWQEHQEKICFLLAGDVVYDMAHEVPRPEKSTGQLVRGSDLDIVIVTSDDLSPQMTEELDRCVLERKHLLLVNPAYREEIDYLIKPLATVRGQLAFTTFEHMVACKILDEAEFLWGSQALYTQLKEMLAEALIPQKLAELTQKAWRERRAAEQVLLETDSRHLAGEFLNLFYTTDEGDEIY